jgi:hypothetical protein
MPAPKSEKEMLSALLGGAIIKAFPDTNPKPWIDFRGISWTEAEIQRMKSLGIAATVPTINMTPKGYKKAKEVMK